MTNSERYQKLLKLKPWYESWKSAKRRCTDTRHKSYLKYGGKGMVFILKKDECAFLWARDKAHLMGKPQLDRKNTARGYSLPNCRFIERIENLKRRKWGKQLADVWED